MAKPTLGFPSRSAAIAALHDEGKSHREIAVLVELFPPSRVNEILKRVADRKRPRALVLPQSAVNSLAPLAAARGCSVVDIATRIIACVVSDGLVDAILDDAA